MSYFTKLRWFLTIAGLFMYMADICTDAVLVFTYFKEKHFAFAALTLLFVAVGLLVTQLFSSAWYLDDLNLGLIKPEAETPLPGVSTCGLAALHLLGMGIFVRYYHLLSQGFRLVWRTAELPGETLKHQHHLLFSLTADLSMLRLMEAFLESVPQLLLQLYITLGRQECSLIQSVGMTISFLNAAWALVDYRRCLRKSLPDVNEMPFGFPTVIYLLYKLGTITSHIFGYALFLIFCTYSTVALAFIWLVGTIWTHSLHTDFCSSRSLEFLYRAIVGVILTFTFFNVKGQGTRDVMIIYYFFHSLINILGPLLLFILRPELLAFSVLLCVSVLMASGSVLGLVCLVIYYLKLHPKKACREADEVDGLGTKKQPKQRLKNFIHP
ncbi:XK-related protein 9 [Takifugu rubripes]|uniref:XK-related protein n=1 Tax=Takifugu rubripes TaxID=31033 RepID=Q5GH45_TAKRU|nr:XK-related protein 9 [Takifugu rubripes]AAT07121.1 XK-related protein 9 [Takifugu rubripes]|eukprot:NP_001027887.1 XK-related protein 9 [Takifugu rubripes]